MDRTYGFPLKQKPLSLFTKDAEIKAHASYVQAKAGDQAAAMRLVFDLALDWLQGHKESFQSDCIFVAPHAQEASGDNAIPQVLSSVCAKVLNGQSDTEIVQIDRVFHTGADAMERMVSRAQFEGQVLAGARYVLIDDVISMGGTLAELGHYIQAHGGIVQGVLVLVNAGRDTGLVPNPKFVQLIDERFGNEFTQLFGIKPSALTANEAQYLVGFQSFDTLRNRYFAAEQEIDRRLRSKGISRTFAPAPLKNTVKQG